MVLPSKKQFEQYSGDDFEIVFQPDQPFTCQINEIKAGLQPQNDAQKEQFSVVFACPEAQVFDQGVYQVSHQEMGEFELFLVPVFGDAQGVQYEAVFT